MEKSRRKYFADCAKLSGPAPNETPQVHLQRSMTLYASLCNNVQYFLAAFWAIFKAVLRGARTWARTEHSFEHRGTWTIYINLLKHVVAILTFVMVGCNA